MERELRQQQMLEAKMAEDKARAMAIRDQGRKEGAMAAKYGMIDPAIEAQVPAGAVQPEMGNEMPPQDEVSSIAAEIDQMVANGKSGEEVNATIAQLPKNIQDGLAQIQQQRSQDQQITDGSIQPNPTVVPPQSPSPANQTKDAVLQLMKQDEQAKMQAQQEAQMQAQQQQ